MKYKRIIFILFLLSLTGLMCINAISQELELLELLELPFLMDLAQLKLEVTNTEVVDQISNFFATLSAKEGYKLVVVTLKGIVTDPCQISIGTDEFSAIYEEGTGLHVKVSSAIAKDDSWSLPQVDSSITSICYIKEPGPIILKVAFILPEKISNFFVRYPALAKGEATISAQAGE